MFKSSLVWCPASEQASETRVKGDAIPALILPTIAACLRRACVAFALATLERQPCAPRDQELKVACLQRQHVANVAVQSGPQHGDMLPSTPVTSLPIEGDQWRKGQGATLLRVKHYGRVKNEIQWPT